MSFRIEDILRKDSSRGEKLATKDRAVSKKNHASNENLEQTATELNSASILQQTLLNRIHPYYSQTNDHYSSERLYSSVHTCDKMYLFHNYPDFYLGSAYPYTSLHARTRFYSPYESLPIMFHLSSKRKGGQVRFTSTQTDALEQRFNSHKYLSPEDRRILADSLKLTDKQVKTWFQNRRAKWRRCNSTSSNSTDTDCEKQTETDSNRAFCSRLTETH